MQSKRKKIASIKNKFRKGLDAILAKVPEAFEKEIEQKGFYVFRQSTSKEKKQCQQ